MQDIADELETDAWVKAPLARLKRYLAAWRLFRELDRCTHPRHTRNGEGP